MSLFTSSNDTNVTFIIFIKKRYNVTQILSVLLVMTGVIITTLSAQPSSKSTKSTAIVDPYTYAKGIGILSLALVLSGFLGLLQDWTHSKHRRQTQKSSQSHLAQQQLDPSIPAAWQESMFYLHFLALPMFLSLLPDLSAQMHEINMSSQRAKVDIPIPSVNLTSTSFLPSFSVPSLPIHILPYQKDSSLLSITRKAHNEDPNTPILLSLSIPHIYLPLIINTITQLLCVAGVHRLTTRVSAVTVTLVLVVRKAVSLIISVVGIAQAGRVLRNWMYLVFGGIVNFFGWDEKRLDLGYKIPELERFLTTLGTTLTGVGSAKKPQAVDKLMMWLGAGMVMLGTFGYTIGSRSKPAKRKEKS